MNGAQSRTKVSIGSTMMQTLELAKDTSWDKAMLNSAKIKPIFVTGFMETVPNRTLEVTR